MAIQLSEHFDNRKLLRFTYPTIMMMIFTSIYGIVDGVFVSNFVGKTEFASVNLIMPFVMVTGAVGFMLGTGGTAVVAKTLGEGRRELANRYFSLIVYTAVVCGAVLTLLGLVFMRRAAIALGADAEMLGFCIEYGSMLMFGTVPFILQTMFQSFLVSAEKPQMGLRLTVLAGITNMVLDYFFVAVFDWGLVGAAMATNLSQVVGSAIPLVYFLRPNDSTLRLGKTSYYGTILAKSCSNGASEMVSNLSLSLVNMLYNYQLMRFVGEDGVSAYGIIMYVNFIFIGVLFGYALGSAPIVSFHFGAGDHAELQNLYRRSLRIVALADILLTTLAELLSPLLAAAFVSYDASLLALTTRGFRIYALSFLFMGINIYASSFFTALGDGLVSAVISFARTLLFQVAAILLLPLLFEVDGIWLAILVAEILGILVSVAFFVGRKSVYHYAA